MEIKSSSLDLVTTQQTVSDNTGDKSVDSFSQFKSMLKSKNQSKDDQANNSKDKDEDNTDLSAAASASGLVQVQNVQVQNEPVQEENVDQSVTQAVSGIVSGQQIETESSTVEITNPFSALDQLRFQRMIGNAADQQESTAENNDATGLESLSSSQGSEIVMASLSEDNSNLTADLLDQSFLAEALEAMKPDLSSAEKSKNTVISSMDSQGSGKDIYTNEELPADMTVTGVDMPVQQMALNSTAMAQDETQSDAVSALEEKKDEPESEKEETSTLETLGTLQETSYDTHRTDSIQTDDTVVYTTVDAENLNELKDKLSEEILKTLDSGKKELEVQLEPQNLGKIRIKVSYESDEVSVSVLCSESKTLKMLSQSAGELGTILESNLERPIQIFVDNQQADYLNNQDNSQQQQQQQQQQQNGSQQEESSEDFLQKLRLGIYEAGSMELSD